MGPKFEICTRTFALEGVGRGRFQQRAGLAVAQGRRFSFVGVELRALDPAHRVMAHGVDFAEVVEKGSDGGQLSADEAGARPRRSRSLKPSDQVDAGDPAHLLGAFDAGTCGEVSDAEAVGAPYSRVLGVRGYSQSGGTSEGTWNSARLRFRRERFTPVFLERFGAPIC